MLLRAALDAGLSVEEFWGLTPREVALCLEAEGRRRRRERDLAGWAAWHTAALTRAKRMPSLKRMLGRDKTRPLRGRELERRRQEHDELVARMGHGGRIGVGDRQGADKGDPGRSG